MRYFSLGRLMIPAAAVLGAAADDIHAQVFRSWINASGGSFHLPGNWSPFGVPTANDGAGFSLAASYTVSFSSSVTTADAIVSGGTVLWDLGAGGTPRTYTAGRVTVGGATAPSLSLRDGSLTSGTVRVHSDGLLSVGPSTGFNTPAAILNVNGLLEVETGADLEVRSSAASGSRHTLNANGDVLVDGGMLRSLGSGTILLAPGRTLTVSNGGVFFQNGPFRAADGKTLRGMSGASISFNQLDVAPAGGTGTAILDGAGSRLSAQFPSFSTDDSHIWGADGGTATIEVRNGATASLRGGLLLASDGSAASATLVVDGPGTLFEQTNVGAGGAPDQIVIGHASTGAATITVRNGAAFTAESGSSGNSRVILNPTGHINVQSGATFAATQIDRIGGGQLDMLGGTVRFDGFTGNLVNQAGTLHPGHLLSSSAGISGNYTQQSNASLKIDIGGIIPGQWQQVFVSGNAILDGAIDLSLIDDFIPVSGNSFTVLQTQFGNVGGRFDRVLGSLPMPGVGLAVTYSNKEVIVRAAVPGDANLDDLVNLSDFNILAGNFGMTGLDWLGADFTGDGLVNLADFNLLAGNFGMSAAGTELTPQDWAALAAAVPEPSHIGVIWMVVPALVRRRRRS